MANPADILVYRERGSGNIDVNVYAASDLRRWFPVYLRLHFIDLTATAVVKAATLTVSVAADWREPTTVEMPWDTVLLEIDGVGLGQDVFYRIEEPEEAHWVIAAGEAVNFAWTNPDTDKIGWGLEVGYIAIVEVLPRGGV